MICRFLSDPVATEALGAQVAGLLPSSLTVYLQGPLGAGKTCLVRGLLRALGQEGNVRSPTYTLVEPYDLGGLRLLHLDLYRLAHPEELEFLGLRDWLGESHVLMVEWPERGAGVLPPPDLEIRLAPADTGREAALIGHTDRGRRLEVALAQT